MFKTINGGILPKRFSKYSASFDVSQSRYKLYETAQHHIEIIPGTGMISAGKAIATGEIIVNLEGRELPLEFPVVNRLFFHLAECSHSHSCVFGCQYCIESCVFITLLYGL